MSKGIANRSSSLSEYAVRVFRLVLAACKWLSAASARSELGMVSFAWRMSNKQVDQLLATLRGRPLRYHAQTSPTWVKLVEVNLPCE